VNGACWIPRTVVSSRKGPSSHLTPHGVRTVDETRSSVTDRSVVKFERIIVTSDSYRGGSVRTDKAVALYCRFNGVWFLGWYLGWLLGGFLGGFFSLYPYPAGGQGAHWPRTPTRNSTLCM
jgi:hypothetical protein